MRRGLRSVLGAVGALAILGCGGLTDLARSSEPVEHEPPAIDPTPTPSDRPAEPGRPVHGPLAIDDALDLVLVPGSTGTVVLQYSDWRCPHCLRAYPRVRDAARASGAELRFRNFPLGAPCNPGVEREDPERCDLARASICAHRFERFESFVDDVNAQPSALIERWSADAGFAACMEDAGVLALVRAQAESGVALGIEGTPTFYVRQEGVWQQATGPDHVLALIEK
ncbi:MAG: DsbA family protein [Myxococcota bacterium]